LCDGKSRENRTKVIKGRPPVRLKRGLTLNKNQQKKEKKKKKKKKKKKNGAKKDNKKKNRREIAFPPGAIFPNREKLGRENG